MQKCTYGLGGCAKYASNLIELNTWNVGWASVMVSCGGKWLTTNARCGAKPHPSQITRIFFPSIMFHTYMINHAPHPPSQHAFTLSKRITRNSMNFIFSRLDMVYVGKIANSIWPTTIKTRHNGIHTYIMQTGAVVARISTTVNCIFDPSFEASPQT